MGIDRRGAINTALAYVLWGLLPVYWKLIEHVSSTEILLHRVIWSFLFVLLLLGFTSGLPQFLSEARQYMKVGRTWIYLALASTLISINWFVFIYAVNHEAILQTSLGYYMNPLIAVLLGYIFLKERMTLLQSIATIVAALAVLYSTLSHGQIPWIALILAFSFGLYALTKKLLQIKPLYGLALETLFMLPCALIYWFYLMVGGNSSFVGVSWFTTLVLCGAGVITAVPLLLFARGAQRIPLYMIGFLQYIAPSLAFILGVFVYDESFSRTQVITFSLIWIALFLFSFSYTKWGSKVRMRQVALKKY
ncbi:EamA family transporter RarD [Mechercharimyces sp. CAU 1602]|uniref:EamA family transporter RarD n=1 Tax=Mechercharimyces sp. CAU 1602 TaxID=2973933 RepID=UPI0037CB81DB